MAASESKAQLGGQSCTKLVAIFRTATATNTAPIFWTTPMQWGSLCTELHTLSLLVLGHRGKLRKLNMDFGPALSRSNSLRCVWPLLCAMRTTTLIWTVSTCAGMPTMTAILC